MGLFKGAAKAGIAAKAVQIVRREAAKPQNQAKAREFVAKLRDRRGARSTAARPVADDPAAGPVQPPR